MSGGEVPANLTFLFERGELAVRNELRVAEDKPVNADDGVCALELLVEDRDKDRGGESLLLPL